MIDEQTEGWVRVIRAGKSRHRSHMKTETHTGPQPFEAKGPGQQWTIDATRSVTIQPGERDEVFVTWTSGKNNVSVRLTKKAAQITAMALLHYGRTLLPDCSGEPVA